MKKVMRLVAVLCCLILMGCSSPEKQLVGKWQLPSTNAQWEFFASGDVTRYSPTSETTTAARYEWIDKTHIRISGPTVAPEVVEIKIDGATLKMVSPDGITLTYQRTQ